ncbi:MAG: POTRA domain-containing protein, partial [Betaproteobacteria bacterium]
MTIFKTLLVLLFSLIAHTIKAEAMVDGVVLKGVEFSGATVFSNRDLQAALPVNEGDRVYAEDILAMVDAITTLYQSAGYITSGATLSNQDVS